MDYLDWTGVIIVTAVTLAGLLVAAAILARSTLRFHRMQHALHAWRQEAQAANPNRPANALFDFAIGEGQAMISLDGAHTWRTLTPPEMDVIRSMGLLRKRCQN